MYPEAFLTRMQQMLGNEYETFLKAFEGERSQALRLNALKQNGEGKTAGEVYSPEKYEQGRVPFAHLSPVPWAENGYYYEACDQPGKHPLHEAGVYYIQEPSAMAPVGLLEVKPGERILDLCAAPGGKSTQIAAKMQGQGFLLCNEIHPARAKILSENVERMGLRNACVTNETPARLAELFPSYFDKILVDAPCSGEGMFRKNEAACEEWSPENVTLCANRQDEILDCAVSMLRPGGRLVYSTCTFAPAENEGSIARLLGRNNQLRLLPVEKVSRGLEGCDGVPESVEGAGEELTGTLRLWPHKIKGEGHFAAVLEKAGEREAVYQSIPAGGLEKGLSPKDPAVQEFRKFCEETLRTVVNTEYETDIKSIHELTNDGIFLRFGDNLYLAPEELPSLKGMKVLRPGLHLGELKKNRFEPSHALALALSPADAQRVCDLSSEEMTVLSYINGQTFTAEGEKGWYLICVDGFSLGWGKLAGGIMKNHYPKGLRKS